MAFDYQVSLNTQGVQPNHFTDARQAALERETLAQVDAFLDGCAEAIYAAVLEYCRFRRELSATISALRAQGPISRQDNENHRHLHRQARHCARKDLDRVWTTLKRQWCTAPNYEASPYYQGLKKALEDWLKTAELPRAEQWLKEDGAKAGEIRRIAHVLAAIKVD